jgi:hypothetical protein
MASAFGVYNFSDAQDKRRQQREYGMILLRQAQEREQQKALEKQSGVVNTKLTQASVFVQNPNPNNPFQSQAPVAQQFVAREPLSSRRGRRLRPISGNIFTFPVLRICNEFPAIVTNTSADVEESPAIERLAAMVTSPHEVSESAEQLQLLQVTRFEERMRQQEIENMQLRSELRTLARGEDLARIEVSILERVQTMVSRHQHIAPRSFV